MACSGRTLPHGDSRIIISNRNHEVINNLLNPAQQAAKKAQDLVNKCIDSEENFLVEAGAGAGKTYCLVETLNYLIEKKGSYYLKKQQHIACITFTNVATNEIESRTDGHPSIYPSTIHSFCWSIIQNFQPSLRQELTNLDSWIDLLAETEGVGKRVIGYDDLGFRSIDDEKISLHHDDVLALTIRLLEYEKFRVIFTARYPVIFIDEYQDTDEGFAAAITKHFIDKHTGPLIGFFGDHWQKIYGNGCGKINTPHLNRIDINANFRSVLIIVNALKQIRPELPQEVVDPELLGSVSIFHTNEWRGKRLTGQHYGGDLPPEITHQHIESFKNHLIENGWDFSPEKTKILMLTHKALAKEQGYINLANAFKYNDDYVKKQDRYIAFFTDILEPVCTAYSEKRYGLMFQSMGDKRPAILSHADKESWSKDMDILLNIRATGTIGDVLEYLKKTKRPHLPSGIENREKEFDKVGTNPDPDEPSSITRLRKLKAVKYKEIITLDNFIDGHTPFSTKHGVKGAEFENVLVVFGRGWNKYDFNKYLELAADENSIPQNKIDWYERNRNLFYVVCSRPKKRLAILFTQKLSDTALKTVTDWFGVESIHAFNI
jgi:DNA helicase-2/ATP-dependent DNA helicase PcrA